MNRVAERLKISAEVFALKFKWLLLTAVQLCGFALVLYGGSPILAPFVESAFPGLLVQAPIPEFDLGAILYIAAGGVLVWFTT